MIYYVFEKQIYLDFHQLLEFSKRNKSFLYRFLKTHNIAQFRYKNAILYKYEDIVRNPYLIKKR